MRSGTSNDWFSPEKRKQLLIIVGLDVTPFEEAIRSDIQTTVVLSVVMLLLGFGGFVSLFWMHSYRAAKKSLQDTSAFADEVVSHLPVGLIATDRSGRITFFNAAAEKITGLRKLWHKIKSRILFYLKNCVVCKKTLIRGKQSPSRKWSARLQEMKQFRSVSVPPISPMTQGSLLDSSDFKRFE